MLQRKWSTEMNKKLHQARIDGDIKEAIRTLAVINGDSINDTTEQALRSWVSTNESKLQKYHYDRSKGLGK